METTSVGADGSVTIRMSAAEAKDVRADLGKTWNSEISEASDYLFRLLDVIHPDEEARP